jgi:hypothetical protein
MESVLGVLRFYMSWTFTLIFMALTIVLTGSALVPIGQAAMGELAGNLVYPVAIVCSASILLAALGLFLKLTIDNETELSGVRQSRENNTGEGENVRAVSGA